MDWLSEPSTTSLLALLASLVATITASKSQRELRLIEREQPKHNGRGMSERGSIEPSLAHVQPSGTPSLLSSTRQVLVNGFLMQMNRHLLIWA